MRAYLSCVPSSFVRASRYCSRCFSFGFENGVRVFFFLQVMSAFENLICKLRLGKLKCV